MKYVYVAISANKMFYPAAIEVFATKEAAEEYCAKSNESAPGMEWLTQEAEIYETAKERLDADAHWDHVHGQ